MEETGLSLRTFRNLLLVLAQLPFSLVLMMHQMLVQIGGGSSIFMQGKKEGPYKFMQVFNGSGRRATQFRM